MSKLSVDGFIILINQSPLFKYINRVFPIRFRWWVINIMPSASQTWRRFIENVSSGNRDWCNSRSKRSEDASTQVHSPLEMSILCCHSCRQLDQSSGKCNLFAGVFVLRSPLCPLPHLFWCITSAWRNFSDGACFAVWPAWIGGSQGSHSLCLEDKLLS